MFTADVLINYATPYISIILATSLSLQTSCELISYSFYIYLPPLPDLWCLDYIFDPFENIA